MELRKQNPGWLADAAARQLAAKSAKAMAGAKVRRKRRGVVVGGHPFPDAEAATAAVGTERSVIYAAARRGYILVPVSVRWA